jgi:hypothetical protein
MSISLWSAGRMTHVKIVAVSFVMTAVVLSVVKSNIRATDFSSGGARNYMDSRPVVAGQSVILSAAGISTIR